MKMYVAGEWTNGRDSIEVRNPYDGSVVDTVPRGSAEDVDRALAGAERGAKVMAALTGYERYEMLHRAGDLIRRDQESLARMLTKKKARSFRRRAPRFRAPLRSCICRPRRPSGSAPK